MLKQCQSRRKNIGVVHDSTVAQSSHPSFAMWRWHTLADCCASIGMVLPTLKLNVHLLVSLSRARDKSLHEKALECQVKVHASLCRSFLLLGSSNCRSGKLIASVIVQSLNKANMLIVGRKGGCSIWPTITPRSVFRTALRKLVLGLGLLLVAIKTCWRRLSA